MPTLVLLFSLSAAAQEAPSAPCTCEPVRTVCMPSVEKKTVTRTRYSCRVKTVCLPGKCAADGCGSCGRPREVRLLIKRFVKEEQPQHVCAPVTIPACSTTKGQ